MPNEDDSLILQIGTEGKEQFKKDLEEIIKSSGNIEDVFNKIGSNTAFKDLNKEVKVGIIEGFSDALKEVEVEMKKTGQDTTKVVTALKEMGKVVTDVDKQTKQSTKSLSALDVVTNGLTEGTLSFRAANRLLTEELKKLALQGKQNTDQYQKLKQKAGEVADTISDVSQEVKTAGSDTRGLDKALRATTALVGGFTALQGAAALFGKDNEELTKNLLKVNAAMSILTGLQAIQEELTKKDSIFKTAAAFATRLWAKAQEELAAATGLTNIALNELGIGLIIGLVVSAIAAYKAFTSETEKLTKATDGLRKAQEKKNESLQQEILLRQNLGVITEKQAAKQKLDAAKKDQIQALINLRALQIAQQDLIKRISDSEGQTELIGQLQKINEEMPKAVKLFNENSAAAKSAQSAYDGFNKAITTTVEKTKEFIDGLQRGGRKDGGSQLEDLLRINSKVKSDTLDNLTKDNEKSIGIVFSGIRKNLIEQTERLKADSAGILDGVIIPNLQGEGDLQPTLIDKLFGTRKQNETERDFRIRIAQETIQGLQSIQSQLSSFTQSLFDNELLRLEENKRKGLISEKQYNKELAAIRRKQAVAAKAEAMFNISINIAQAITKALTTGPIIGQVLAGITAALGFAQLAVVAARPIPTFGAGGSVAERFKGSGFVKGRSHREGGVPAELEGNEFVHKGAAVKKYGVKFMEEINNLKYNPLSPTVLIPDIESMQHGRELKELIDKFDTMEDAFAEIARHIKNGNRDRLEGTSKLLNKFANRATRYV